MLCRNLKKRSKKSKKRSKFDSKIRTTIDLAKVGSDYCCDETKNCYNKEMSKWPEDCRNNRFSVTTKNQ